MIFDFMMNHSNKYPVDKMARIFSVSRAGYYRYSASSESVTERKNEELLLKIRAIKQGKRQVYGSPRIHDELIKQGENCSRKRIARIMRKNNIRAKTVKKWKPTTRTTKDSSRIAPNLVNQNFTADYANQVWVTDITYVSTREGWLYVSTVLDLYSRKIVGLSMGSRADTALVLASLQQAIIHRDPPKGLIIHSDRGCQYSSDAFINNAKAHAFVLSMSAKGNCYDNAVMESFFHTLKAEHVFFENYLTRKEAIASIFEYIEVFYNRQRAHSTLNYMTPVEFESQQLQFGNPILMSSRMKLARPAIEVIGTRIRYV